MDQEFFHLFFTCLCMNASVYSVHNFVTNILETTGVLNVKRIVKMQVVYLLKFLSAIIFTNVCDKKGGHKYVLAVCSLSYSFSTLALLFVKNLPEEQRYTAVIFCLFFYTIGNGGLFPIMDSLNFQYLRKTNRAEQLGRLRFSGTSGHLLANILLTSIHFICERTKWVTKGNLFINVSLCITFALCTLILALSLPYKGRYEEKEKNTSADPEHSNYFTAFKKLVSVVFICYCISVLCAGIDRVGVSNFLSQYLKNIKINMSEIHVLYLWRTLPELLIYGVSEFLARFLSLDIIYMMAIFLTLIRSLFYGFVELEAARKSVKLTLLFATESTKGFYSALFHYSAMRIFNTFSDGTNVSTAQGVFYSLYNSLPYIPFSLLQSFFPDKLKGQLPTNDLQTLFKIVSFVALFAFIGPIVRLSVLGLKKKTPQ